MAYATGYYRLEHTYLSRKGNKRRGPSGPRHLRSVGNYHANARRVGAVAAVNLPTDRRELHQAYREHDATIKRANGRIAETLIVCFDKRMSYAHQEEAAERMLWRVTFDGRIKGVAHHHRNDPGNPHAHIILMDADENGRQVGYFGRSGSFRRENSPVKGNPTEWFRKVWEDECNAVLEEHGYEFRIDRRSNLERGLDKPGEHRGITPIPEMEPVSAKGEGQQELTDHTEQPLEMVEPLPEMEECPPMPVDAPEADPYPAALSTEADMARKYTPKEAVEVASGFYDELRELRHIRSQLEAHESAIQGASIGLEAARLRSRQAYEAKDTAEKQLFDATRRLEPYLQDGRLKGWGVSLKLPLFGELNLRSPTRKAAEKAQATYEALSAEFARNQAILQSSETQIERWNNVVKENTQKRDMARQQAEQMIEQFGPNATLESAEVTLNHTCHSYLHEITVEEVQDLYESGQISTSQYRDALELMGEEELLQRLEETQAEGLDERVDRYLSDEEPQP